jgi:hypothetical protein
MMLSETTNFALSPKADIRETLKENAAVVTQMYGCRRVVQKALESLMRGYGLLAGIPSGVQVASTRTVST